MEKTKAKNCARAVALLGVMSALAAVCAGVFPFGLTVRVGDFIKLSPVFLIVALAGNMYGWWGAALVAFLGDFLQSLFSGLGFSPLVSAVNVLCGVCFGLILHHSNSIVRIVTAVMLTQVVGSLGLTTAALHIQYGMPFIPTIYWRALQTVILIVAEILLLWLVMTVLNLPEKLRKLGK